MTELPELPGWSELPGWPEWSGWTAYGLADTLEVGLLIPGDTGQLTALAAAVRGAGAVAAEARAAARTATARIGDEATGEVAEGVRRRLESIGSGADAMVQVSASTATVLDDYVAAIQVARARAQAAAELWRSGGAFSGAAAATGDALRAQATAMLDRARLDLSHAADDFARTLRRVGELLPGPPSWWEDPGWHLEKAAEGVGSILPGLVDGLGAFAAVDQALLAVAHPWVGPRQTAASQEVLTAAGRALHEGFGSPYQALRTLTNADAWDYSPAYAAGQAAPVLGGAEYLRRALRPGLDLEARVPVPDQIDGSPPAPHATPPDDSRPTLDLHDDRDLDDGDWPDDLGLLEHPGADWASEAIPRRGWAHPETPWEDDFRLLVPEGLHEAYVSDGHTGGYLRQDWDDTAHPDDPRLDDVGVEDWHGVDYRLRHQGVDDYRHHRIGPHHDALADWRHTNELEESRLAQQHLARDLRLQQQLWDAEDEGADLD